MNYWLTSLGSFLPPAESQAAYEALPSAVSDIPGAYTRRELLWQAVEGNLSSKKYERATQLANALDGEYRQSALAQIEVARE